jgi:hypothetical protein
VKRGLSEKKNEEATVNMVMAITTKSKVLEEEVFQEREPLKGKNPPRLARRGEVWAINCRDCLRITKG